MSAMTEAQINRIPLAVLISGSGRTLKNFLDLQRAGSLRAELRLVISSSAKAAGLKFAKDFGVRTEVVTRGSCASDEAFSEKIFGLCREVGAEFVAMAGFMKFVPIPEDFENRVLNIHPALIPAFCGCGLYGMKVHEALLEYGAKVAGATVHFVDNQYDHGPIILQQTTPVAPDDTPRTLADRVFETEKQIYPRAINLLAAGALTVEGRRVTITNPMEEKGS